MYIYDLPDTNLLTADNATTTLIVHSNGQDGVQLESRPTNGGSGGGGGSSRKINFIRRTSSSPGNGVAYSDSLSVTDTDTRRKSRGSLRLPSPKFSRERGEAEA